MSMRWRVCVFAILLSLDCQAQEKAPKLDRIPAALEREFALSAAPPHLRDKATVYLLDPAKGYVVDRQGTNGISCVVVRTDWQFTAPLRDDVFWAVCFDAEGSNTLLQDYLYAAELRARGGDARSVHAEVTRRFGTPTSPNPSRTGVAYMIAPIMRGYTSAPTPVTMNMPHYMFYAPNLKNADIGGGGFSKEYPFMLSMSPGRDDFIIMLAGETETSKIIQDSKDLLDRLCSYHSSLCTNAGTRARTPVDQTPE